MGLNEAGLDLELPMTDKIKEALFQEIKVTGKETTH